MMGKLLAINHRFKEALTKIIFNNLTKHTTHIITKAIIDKLKKSRLYPLIQEEAHNLEIAVDILKHFAYSQLSSCFPAGNTVSLCYPNIKSIKTSLSHKSDALFSMRPNISTCTEESNRSYIARMVNRMVEEDRSYIWFFIFGMTEYGRVVNLECWYRERETLNLMFRGQYHNAEPIVEKAHWGTEELWVEAFQAKILNPFQVIDEEEEEE